MLKETYYVIGNPLESDEDYMNKSSGLFPTKEIALKEVEIDAKLRGHKTNYEIAKVTIYIERGIERVVL